MIYDRILIKIRERSFLDLLDLTLLVVRSRPLPIVAAAAIGIAPFAALNQWILSDPDVPLGFLMFLLIMEAPWATAPLTLMLGDLMFATPISWRRYLKTLLVAFPKMFLTHVLFRGFLFLTFVGFAIVMYRSAFANEVILLERVRWRDLSERNRRLVRGIEGELFGRSVAQAFFGSVFVACFSIGSGVIGSALAGGELTWRQSDLAHVERWLVELGAWVAVGFFGVYGFLAYIDRRIRLEGWELELRLKEAGRALEERLG
jgi:hypothetical protein